MISFDEPSSGIFQMNGIYPRTRNKVVGEKPIRDGIGGILHMGVPLPSQFEMVFPTILPFTCEVVIPVPFALTLVTRTP